LLQYTLVLPANFDPNNGPKILENIKGLFSTKGFQSKKEILENNSNKEREINEAKKESSQPETNNVNLICSTEAEFQFIKSFVVDPDRSIDLINFDQSSPDQNNKLISHENCANNQDDQIDKNTIPEKEHHEENVNLVEEQQINSVQSTTSDDNSTNTVVNNSIVIKQQTDNMLTEKLSKNLTKVSDIVDNSSTNKTNEEFANQNVSNKAK
jgi:hypothetical protein